ncbi:MAG TPA: MFS transporter [Thermoanaerobaculia bacterium]|nr:MFS transporter [Thermoanaerobaculia bacterium]
MLRSILSTYREAFSGLSRAVWLLALATLVNRSGTMVLPFLVLYLTQKQGFETADAGWALGIYGLGGVLGSYLGGWLCDRMPARRVMVATLSLSGIGFIILGQLGSRPAILVTIFFLAVMGEGFRPANAAAVAAATSPELRTRAFALSRLAINLGMSLGPSIGGFLAMVSYDWLFLVDGATCLLAAAVLAVAFHSEDGKAAADTTISAEPVRSPWRDRPFLAMMGLCFLMALITFQIPSTFPLTLRDLYGFKEGHIGLVLAVNTVIIVLFEMVLVHRVAGLNPLRVVGVGGLLFGLGMALLPFGTGFAFAAFSVVVWTVGEMLAFPIVAGAVANRARDANRGLYMGIFTLSFEGAWVFSPILGTWVYQVYGAKALWTACGVAGVILLVGFYGVAAAVKREGPARTL